MSRTPCNHPSTLVNNVGRSWHDALLAPFAPVTVEYRASARTITLAKLARLSTAECFAWRDEAFAELRAALSALGLERAGADGALYFSELLEDEYGEAVAFVPVHGTPRSLGGVEPFELARAEYAIATHPGTPDDLDKTFVALGSVVSEREIGIEGPMREDYLIGPLDTTDETSHITEICCPIFQTTIQGGTS